MADGEKREIFLEFVVQGAFIKATAIDSATGTEACIFGPVHTSRSILTQNAVAKLEYILKKQAGSDA